MAIEVQVQTSMYATRPFISGLRRHLSPSVRQQYNLPPSKMPEAQVQIKEGLLQGRVAETVRGGIKYYSFQGIPYAQPPVGNLRFKPPVPITPWSGVRDALKEGKKAPSLMLPSTTELEPNSDEDCLFLNVYTKQLPKGSETVKRPVLFYIHGGGFVGGSGDSDLLAPDYLMKRDIVLVTINYRLGALGFLSLLNEACPGNNGLRDQVEALKWTQRNIASFGGDPSNVMIFGESAGSASVQYLMLSPLSKGLFHKAISQSGSVLNPWALTRCPVEAAFAMGEELGFKTTDKGELLEFLKKAPPKDLVLKSTKLMRTVEPDIYYGGIAFAPVVEPDLPGAFLARHPEELVNEGRLHDVPYIMGVLTLEGPIVMKAGAEIKEPSSKEEWERLLPIHPNLKRGTALADSIIEKIKARYFSKGFTKQAYADVLSWEYFLFGNHFVLQSLSNTPARKSKTYSYQFTFDGALAFLKNIWGLSPELKGTFHSDELSYLFWNSLLSPTVTPGSDEDKMIDIITELWTNFAEYGNPTPNSGIWKPFAKPDEDYLEINLELTPGQKLDEPDAKFWRGIFSEIANASSSKL